MPPPIYASARLYSTARITAVFNSRELHRFTNSSRSCKNCSGILESRWPARVNRDLCDEKASPFKRVRTFWEGNHECAVMCMPSLRRNSRRWHAALLRENPKHMKQPFLGSLIIAFLSLPGCAQPPSAE